MEENLKQKLKKHLRWFILNAIVWLKCSYVFAASKEENLSDEFFNAAMQVEAKDSPLSVDATAQTQTAAGKATEQAMAAEQVGDEAMLSGNNVLDNIKEFLKHGAEKLQDVGNSIGHSLQNLTGGNPLITKLLVALILVVISIVIVVVLIVIAKKFIFKKKNMEEFEDEEDEEFDDSDFEDEEIETIEDSQTPDNTQDDDFEEIEPISHTKIPPKSTIKDEQPTQTQGPSSIPVKPQQIKHLASADSIQTAMKIFLKVTED